MMRPPTHPPPGGFGSIGMVRHPSTGSNKDKSVDDDGDISRRKSSAAASAMSLNEEQVQLARVEGGGVGGRDSHLGCEGQETRGLLSMLIALLSLDPHMLSMLFVCFGFCPCNTRGVLLVCFSSSVSLSGWCCSTRRMRKRSSTSLQCFTTCKTPRRSSSTSLL